MGRETQKISFASVLLCFLVLEGVRALLSCWSKSLYHLPIDLARRTYGDLKAKLRCNRTGAWNPTGAFSTLALFSSENFLDFDTVALSFLFNKHCLIID